MRPRLLTLLPVAVLAVAATGCGSAATSSPATASGAATSPGAAVSGDAVSITNFKFVPDNLAVKVGTSVTFTNTDSATHTVTSDTGTPASFDSGNLDKGKTFSFTFATAGKYTYHCNIHQFMTATITVS